jgi:hypothetical protein
LKSFQRLFRTLKTKGVALFAVQTDLGNASGIAKNRTGRITFDGDLFFKLSDMTGKTGRFTLGAFQ